MSLYDLLVVGSEAAMVTGFIPAVATCGNRSAR
jgi:hypothetical protein